MTKAAKRARAREGMDGAVVIEREVRTSSRQTFVQHIRARPGTFEWRYASADRGDDGARYHAGSQFARVWERAGIASVGPSGISDATGGDWKGLPDGRCVAMDEVKEIALGVGKLASARLVAYCVEGRTVADIAMRWNVPARDMAAILAMDLRALAIHLRYLKG